MAGIMHTLKKTTFKIAHGKEPENSEFIDYKQRISNMVKALTESSQQLEKAEKQWRQIYADQKKHAENFANLYPDDDDIRTVAKSAVEVMKKIDDATSPAKTEAMSHTKIHRQVKTFLAEYKTLESEYSKLTDAKTEYEMYKKKVDDLEKAKKQDEEKILRNASKFEEVKTTYENQLEAVISRQKAFYGKRKEVFRASFVSFWLAQQTYESLIGAECATVLQYAKQHEKAMLELDVGSLKSEE
eukprot:CAMPEP_0184697556 /NCGR_PEP_ID=MMETSP0313-20130426/4487_1 /TAXON_ID=2792 /ORGANISM="Porphyridium aerugineum, Strain SAG 1380-2" /LENGTH=242 /DNA_ID=CAMNT_0027156369 /DNA_START=290 /DNA_END=1018 /DNA_ORIENTATION=+